MKRLNLKTKWEAKVPDFPARLVLLSEDTLAFEKAKEAMQKQNKSLELIVEKPVEEGGIRYWVRVCKVSRQVNGARK